MTTPEDKPKIIEYTKGNGEEMTIRLLNGILEQLKEMNYYLAQKEQHEEVPKA